MLSAEAAGATSAAAAEPAWPTFAASPTENGHLSVAESADTVKSRPDGGSSSDSDDGQYTADHGGGGAAGDLANGGAAELAVGSAGAADAGAGRSRCVGLNWPFRSWELTAASALLVLVGVFMPESYK